MIGAVYRARGAIASPKAVETKAQGLVAVLEEAFQQKNISPQDEQKIVDLFKQKAQHFQANLHEMSLFFTHIQYIFYRTGISKHNKDALKRIDALCEKELKPVIEKLIEAMPISTKIEINKLHHYTKLDKHALEYPEQHAILGMKPRFTEEELKKYFKTISFFIDTDDPEVVADKVFLYFRSVINGEFQKKVAYPLEAIAKSKGDCDEAQFMFIEALRHTSVCSIKAYQMTIPSLEYGHVFTTFEWHGNLYFVDQMIGVTKVSSFQQGFRERYHALGVCQVQELDIRKLFNPLLNLKKELSPLQRWDIYRYTPEQCP